MVYPAYSTTMRTSPRNCSTDASATLLESGQQQQSPPSCSSEEGRSRRKPQLPLQYGMVTSPESRQQLPLDLSRLWKDLQYASDQRTCALEQCQTLQKAIFAIRQDQEGGGGLGTSAASTALQSLVETYAPLFGAHSTSRNGFGVSHAIQDWLCTASFQHFLVTGAILPPVPWATDEEYLAGAIMGLCSDELPRYALGRATVRDGDSVQMAAQAVTAMHDLFLVQLDFRNGPLRRKYDACKYAQKTMETLLYELAVTTPPAAAATTTTLNPAVSSPRNNQELDRNSVSSNAESLRSLLPVDQLEALVQRMIQKDALREELIKACRDAQKSSKQAIFALHRSDRATATALLNTCAQTIRTQLWPIVQQESSLRNGAFAAVLEEFVEAQLFFAWLHGKNKETVSPEKTIASTSSTSKTIGEKESPVRCRPNGLLLHPEDFVPDILDLPSFALEASEYLGGLCDLTGEIGRFAVHRGTVRDVDSVQDSWHANSQVSMALSSMSLSLPTSGCVSKNKVDAVRTSVQKLERMLYELSLSEAAGGGRTVHSSTPISTTSMNDGYIAENSD